MSTKDKSVNGFKFSFKKQENSQRSTPKFTSIQLDANGFTRMQNKTLNKTNIQYKNRNNETKNDQNFHTKSKKKIRNLQMSYSHKNISVPIGDNFYFEKTQQISKSNHSSSKSKITLNVDNKKVIVINRPKKIEIIKSQSFKKLFKTQISVQQQQKSATNADQDQKTIKQAGSYLANFKRQKKKMQLSKQKPKLSSIPKKPLLNLDESQKRDQSPKSNHSFREAPKIFNKFFPKINQPQFFDTNIFPETARSKKFMQETQSNSYFRKNEKNQTKKNLGISKALFNKPQKSNVNVRLNNIGGHINKLNIHID